MLPLLFLFYVAKSHPPSMFMIVFADIVLITEKPVLGTRPTPGYFDYLFPERMFWGLLFSRRNTQDEKGR